MNVAPRRPVIAVISAVDIAVEPARAAISAAIPGAVVWNIVDDRLMADAVAGGGVTAALAERMGRLVDHAIVERADGVLVTCSLYGDTVAELAKHVSTPLLPPDEAAFAAVLARDWRRVLVVAPIAEALADSQAKLARSAAAAQIPLTITGVVAEDLPDPPLRTPSGLAVALTKAIAPNTADVDGVLLAQFSLAPAAELLSAELGIPVLTTPDCAARLLADRLYPVGATR